MNALGQRSGSGTQPTGGAPAPNLGVGRDRKPLIRGFDFSASPRSIPGLKQASNNVPSPPTTPAANLPGRIFLVTRKQDDPMSGVVAIDPNSSVVRKIIEDNFQGTRVSPDGRFVASTGITACGRASKERGIWIYDTLSERKPLKVFDGVSVPCGWSRDGKAIAVTILEGSDAVHHSHIEVVDLDGRSLRAIPLPLDSTGPWLVGWK